MGVGPAGGGGGGKAGPGVPGTGTGVCRMGAAPPAGGVTGTGAAGSWSCAPERCWPPEVTVSTVIAIKPKRVLPTMRASLGRCGRLSGLPSIRKTRDPGKADFVERRSGENLGRFARRAGSLRQGGNQVPDLANLPHAHAHPVEAVLKSKVD